MRPMMALNFPHMTRKLVYVIKYPVTTQLCRLNPSRSPMIVTSDVAMMVTSILTAAVAKAHAAPVPMTRSPVLGMISRGSRAASFSSSLSISDEVGCGQVPDDFSSNFAWSTVSTGVIVIRSELLRNSKVQEATDSKTPALWSTCRA